MTDILKRKALKPTHKNTIKHRLFDESMANNKQQQPDSAFLTQQTVADIPQNMPAA